MIFEISATSREVRQLLRRIPQDGSGTAGVAIDEDECRPVDAVVYAQHRPDSRLEAAYHRADAAIQKVVDLLAAA
jgi:hypothetical protein